jgi:myo-inositol 2-dehydrogenase/D-chiro-inositol 1-dehydrogenase
MMDRLRIGIIGAGGMGLHHGINFHRHISGVQVAGFYEPDPSRAEAARAAWGNPPAFGDPRELICSRDIDAVVIASPDATHAGLVLACLEEKKPVFCEKPLAVDLKDAGAIVEGENALGKRCLALGFHRRFDPRHRLLKEIVDSGTLGPPLLWKGVHRNPEAMYHSSGAFIMVNSAGHDIDSARWLLGAEVKTIQVRGLKSRPDLEEEARDFLIFQMELSGPALACGEVYVNAAYGYEVSAEVVCQRGSAVTGEPGEPVVRFEKRRGAAISGDFRAAFTEAYLAEMIEWTRSLREDRPFRGASAWDGYAAAAVSLAGAASLAENRGVEAALPPTPPLYR